MPHRRADHAAAEWPAAAEIAVRHGAMFRPHIVPFPSAAAAEAFAADLRAACPSLDATPAGSGFGMTYLQVHAR